MSAERGYVARSGTGATNTTTVALTAATAKSVVGVLGSANDTICVIEFAVSFSSATATDAPATVELCEITALGTMTSFTPAQVFGIPLASSCSAGYNATVEPTISTIHEAHYVPAFNGLLRIQYPLGREPTVAAVSHGFALRVTAPSATNCLAFIKYAE